MRQQGSSRPFNLLRWFSIASVAAVLPVAALTGVVFSQFITQEELQRDAALTAEFIQNCIDVESMQFGVKAVGLAQFLDPRVDPQSGTSPDALAVARANVYEHLQNLPDVLVTNVLARDGRIVWSSKKHLLGTSPRDRQHVEQVFTSGSEVFSRHAVGHETPDELRLGVEHKDFLIENALPLVNAKGEVVAVAQVYKESPRLTAAIRRGQLLVWGTTLAGGLVIWLALFSIIRRASAVLFQQERDLVEAEASSFLGEMATALAHSLRNPLGSMRSSAELAGLSDDAAVRKNAHDIIAQVDFLSKWVRELLLYSRPLPGDAEPVDVCAVVTSVLASFRATLDRARVVVQWNPAPSRRPLVEGNTTLITQALHGVVSNAVEAMPRGGELRVQVSATEDPARIDLVVADTGIGMTPDQLANAFKPFHTTKAHGLGVGLAILKRAMERFGGSVALSSAADVGTEVRLRFQVRHEVAGQVDAEPAAAAAVCGTARRSRSRLVAVERVRA